MGDPTWLCLFRADFADKNNVKGNLRVKIKVQDLDEIAIDKDDNKRLNISIVFGQKLEHTSRISLIFDTIQKTIES